MRNPYICIILIIFSLSVSFPGSAQTWRLLESGANLKGPSQEIVPLPSGDILTITHPGSGKKGPMTISRFDQQLDEVYTRKISLLSHERYQSAWFDNGHIWLFCTDKTGGLTRYQLDIDFGSLTGQPLPLTGLLEIDQFHKPAAFYTGNSPDSAFHYIVSATPAPRGKDLYGILLNRQGEKTALFHTSLPATTNSPIALTQANDGTLALIYTSADPSAAERYAVLCINTDGHQSTFALSGLPEGRLRYTSWTAEGKTLRFSGWMNHSGNTGMTTVVTGSVDLLTGSVFNLRQTEVTTLLARALPAVQNRLQNGLPAELTLLRQLQLTDGSRYVLFESSGHHLYQNHFSPATQNPLAALGRSGTFTSLSPSTQAVTYQSRGDVYVLKLDEANQPQWLDVLSKNQEEWDKVTAIGVGSLLDRQNRLHVFFYDSKLNGDACASEVTPFRADDPRGFGFACISILPDGAMTKQFILPEDHRYRLMPELAFVDNKDEACFLAVRSAQYKLGTIALK
jgi:hypothetical protein